MDLRSYNLNTTRGALKINAPLIALIEFLPQVPNQELYACLSLLNSIHEICICLKFSSKPSAPVISNLLISDDDVLTTARFKRDTWAEMAEKFNPKLDTKILVHGWKSSTQSNSIKSIRGAYMQRGHINVFGN